MQKQKKICAIYSLQSWRNNCCFFCLTSLKGLGKAVASSSEHSTVVFLNVKVKVILITVSTVISTESNKHVANNIDSFTIILDVIESVILPFTEENFSPCTLVVLLK